MRKLCLMVLSALILTGTIVMAVDYAGGRIKDEKGDSSGDDITLVRVWCAGDPPVYEITLCVDKPCPTSGEFIVNVGKAKVNIKKSGGGWSWRVQDKDGNWLGQWAAGNWQDSGDDCCFTISNLSGPELDNPAEEDSESPPGVTGYSVTFSASGNGDSTSENDFSWGEKK